METSDVLTMAPWSSWQREPSVLSPSPAQSWPAGDRAQPPRGPPGGGRASALGARSRSGKCISNDVPRAGSLWKAPTDRPRHPKPQRAHRTNDDVHARQLCPWSLPEPPGSPTVWSTHHGPGHVRAARTERNVGLDEMAGHTTHFSVALQLNRNASSAMGTSFTPYLPLRSSSPVVASEAMGSDPILKSGPQAERRRVEWAGRLES